MILGSHNSLSFLTPNKWWMKLFNFYYKTQDKNLVEQIKSGVHMFDIRVRFTTDGLVKICHNGWEYKNAFVIDDFVNIILDTIRIHKIDDEKYYIRLVLETSETRFGQELMFIDLGNCFKKMADENIVIFGGQRKFDWSRVIVTIPDYFVACPVSTMDKRCRWYEKICPRWFAKRMNKKTQILWEKEKHCIVAFDFV